MYLSLSFQERVMHTVTKYNTKYVLCTLVKQNAGNSVSIPDIVVVLIPTNKHSLFFFFQNLDIVDFLLQSWNTVAVLQAVKLL